MNIPISIVIPVFNSGQYLTKVLDSVIAQSYSDWECIVVDDHSTDNTIEVLSEYVKKDPRVIAASNSNKKGAPGARNTGLFLAKYDWILFFDSDNCMYKNLLEVVSAHLDGNIDIVVWFSRVVDEKTGEVVSFFKPTCTRDLIDDIWTERCYVDTNNAIIRKNKLMEVGGWDECCPSMQEWDLHLRLSSIACYMSIPQILVDYYTGIPTSISANKMRGMKSRLYLLKKYRRNWFVHKEAGVLNYQEILRLYRETGTYIGCMILRCYLLLIAPLISLTVLKRRVRRLLGSILLK